MKKPITIVSTICSLLFLAAIIVFASGVYIDKKKGTEKADARYEQLLSQTKENFTTNSYGSSEFSINFIRAIGNINDFSSLKLEVNGTLVYSYPPSTFSIPSPELIKSYSDTVNAGGKNFTLRASLYLMTPGSIYNHSRLAFLLILTGTLLVGIFIVFTNGSESSADEGYTIRPKTSEALKNLTEKTELEEASKTQTPAVQIEEKPEEPEPQTLPETEPEQVISFTETKEEPVQEAEQEPLFPQEPIFQPEQNQQASEEPETTSIEFPTEKPVFDEEDEQEWNNEELFDDDEPEDFYDNTVQNFGDHDNSGLDIIDQMEQENLALTDEDFFGEKTPVSPVTNLVLQSSLEEKLDEKILSNPNATLALVKINGLDRGNSISQKIVSILSESSGSKQLFEYKADSYAQITESDLQTTVDRFEDLYNKIAGLLKDNNAANEVSVGISSASGRKIKAERVILEAGQALDYASQDPDSPIVAFRANPEKYKEYIESNS